MTGAGSAEHGASDASKRTADRNARNRLNATAPDPSGGTGRTIIHQGPGYASQTSHLTGEIAAHRRLRANNLLIALRTSSSCEPSPEVSAKFRIISAWR